MYAPIATIPYYQTKGQSDPEPYSLMAPVTLTFEVQGGRSYSEPQIFGPYLWFLLHTTASNIPDHLTPQQQRSFRTFVTNLPVLIPCQVCREHAYTYITTHVPRLVLDGKESVFTFYWTFHNFVNSRVANPRITLNEAKHLYGYEFPQNITLTCSSTGQVHRYPMLSQAAYGPLLRTMLLIAAVYYPDNPTRFVQGMMTRVIYNLGWLIPGRTDKAKAISFLMAQDVTTAVTRRELLFRLFYRLLQSLGIQGGMGTLAEAKASVNYDSYGQGQVVAFKY